jgi:hypothetical protein
MSHKYVLSFLLLIATVFFFNINNAQACSCAPSPSVLDAYEGADVVVIAKVASVHRTEKGNDYQGISSTNMTVEKVFKGSLKVGNKMVFSQGGGADCIWTFDEKDIGREFLFYLHAEGKNPDAWMAVTCGRSTSVEHGGDDLLYLENMAKVRGKTRISGTLGSLQTMNVSVAGRKIRIIGKDKTYEVITDKHGVYEIYDLPAGKYLIEPELPHGWKIDNFMLRYSSGFAGNEKADGTLTRIPIVLESKKHAALDIYFDVDNAIRGKVYDPNGNLMRGVCLNLLPIDEDASTHFYKADCTEEDGAFNINEIPAGSYHLVANKEGKISSSEPFPTFYYPNTFEREKAAIITINEGDFLEDINIRVPQLQETIIVEGVFLYSNGKPVVDEAVQFKTDKTEENIDGDARTKTDANGRFSIKILKGLKGKLYGTMYTYSGQFENCPKLESIIKKMGNRVPEVITPALEIQADRHLSDVELKYHFPSCKKAKTPE